MEFFHGIVALIAGIVLVLTGLVAWLYIQQSRMSQAINALAIAITTPPPSFLSHPEVQEEETPQQQPIIDDRVSVHEEPEHEEEEEQEETGVVGEDITDLAGKTVAQLRELLTAKGIPFNKSDKKPVLLSLVQAAS